MNDQGTDQNDKDKLKKIRTNISSIALKKLLKEEARIETFKKLDFNDCPIDSDSLKCIADCSFLKNLQSLSLKNTYIDDDGIKVESKIEKLRD